MTELEKLIEERDQLNAKIKEIRAAMNLEEQKSKQAEREEKTAVKSERNKRIWNARKNGATFEEIGKKERISKSRAHEIYEKMARKANCAEKAHIYLKEHKGERVADLRLNDYMKYIAILSTRAFNVIRRNTWNFEMTVKEFCEIPKEKIERWTQLGEKTLFEVTNLQDKLRKEILNNAAL